jgi:holo-[acyl-carrier protein] synthase
MIRAVGIDLVDISRVKKLCDKWGKKFLERVYSEGEIRYCESKFFPAQHYAARFAAKEAFLKCLGVGMGGGVNLKDIEVENNGTGKPDLKIRGSSNLILHPDVTRKIHISLSHTDKEAAAVVVIEEK